MKVITIKEPWASLIINGYKEYEFRSWKTKYRGKILIQSSISPDKNGLKRFKDYNLDYGCGEIIGEAELVDCIKIDDKLKQQLLKKEPEVYKTSNFKEDYGFKLVNIKKYQKRIKIKGKLGIWDYESTSSK